MKTAFRVFQLTLLAGVFLISAHRATKAEGFASGCDYRDSEFLSTA